jgi:hypothetical protein
MAYSDEISPKQKSLIEKLMASLPAKLDQAAGSPEAEQVTQAVEQVQEILVQVLSGGTVTVGEARPLISVLIDADKLLGRAVAATATPGITGAERIIPNKFGKDCKFCKNPVAANEGHAALVVGSWITVCAQCASETPQVRSERLAAVPAPIVPAKIAAPQVGVYTDPAGGLVKVYNGSYKLQGKRNDGQGWKWTGNKDFTVAIPENKITAEEAAAFGHENDECVFCGLALNDPRSTETGYGPICAKKHSLPWGEKASNKEEVMA